MLSDNDYEKNLLNKVDMIENLFFDPKGIHGINHTKRVLILLNKIMDSEDLSDKDRSILTYSALYHDTGRDSDRVDSTHGIKSYRRLIQTDLLDYLKLDYEDMEILRFIIEQHPIEDEFEDKNIKRYYNITDENRALKLYEIFKDADGLDRVRLGDLNPSYLRLEYSKTLVDEAQQLYKKIPECNYQERFKSTRQRLINKEITKEIIEEKKYCFYNALLLSKVNNCNMRYNPEIENSKCDNKYFKSIINDLNNIDRIEKIDEINDLRDHILWLKQNGNVIEVKNDSISMTPNYSDEIVSIYPVKRNNYHLLHGTTLESAKKILEDGYIKATEILSSQDFNKVFFSNSTKYASIFGMSGGSSNIFSTFLGCYKEPNEYSIVFQINTSKYDVYHYCTYCTYGLYNEEYFIWNNVSVKDIEKIYLMKYYEIVREIELNELNDLEFTKEISMDEKISEKGLKELRRCHDINEHLFPKVKDCNTIYNSEIEGSRCNNSYFQSIINAVNNADRIESIYEINDLKDHILYLKQNGNKIEVKNDSILISTYRLERLLIYPVKKGNYHLFHGTTLESAKKIMKDGYIKANKEDKLSRSYQKTFLSNSSEYAGSYSDLRRKTSEKINGIVFQIDTSKYDVYHYCAYFFLKEYFIWGDISVKDIEKIYMVKDCNIVREIGFNELNDLEYKKGIIC